MLTFLSALGTSPHIFDNTLVKSWCPTLPSRANLSCTSLRFSWQNQKKALAGFLGALGSRSFGSFSALLDFLAEDSPVDFDLDLVVDLELVGTSAVTGASLVLGSRDCNLSLASCA